MATSALNGRFGLGLNTSVDSDLDPMHNILADKEEEAAQGASSFGIGTQSTYRTSEQAADAVQVRQAEMQPTSTGTQSAPSTPVLRGSFLDMMSPSPSQSSSGGMSFLDAMGYKAPTPEPEPQSTQGDFSRGFSVAGKQLKQTAYGTIALIGDTIGIDGVKEFGLKGYKNAEEEIQKISKASDSFTDAWDKSELGKWVTYSLGYLGGQVLEAGVAAVGGAVAGSLVAPGAGTIGGAITGAVEKSAAQAGVKSLVAKMIDAEASKLMSNQITKELATEMATKAVYRKMGQTAALSLLNGSQELGSIYGEAVEQSEKTGEQLSLGKVWLSGILATAVDSWADSKAISRFTDAFKAKGGVGGFAIEAFKGGVREGLTEGVQTGIERWGASKELSSPEAIKDYVDSMAVGVLGGGISGGASGLVGRVTKEKDAESTDTGNSSTTNSKTLDPKLDGRMPGSGESTDTSQSSSPIDLKPINMSASELLDTAKKDPAYMAAVYQMGTPDQKKEIESIVATAGTKDAFDAAFKSPETLAAGKAKIQDQSQADLVLNSVQDSIALKASSSKKIEVPADIAARDAELDAAANVGTTATKPPVKLSSGSTATTTVEKTTAAGATTVDTTLASKAPVSFDDIKPDSAPPLDIRLSAKPASKTAGAIVAPETKLYTSQNLPDAIFKVMTALTGQGVVSFQDATSEVMTRMRQSKNWSGLAGSVTPNMLRTAYNKLSHAGKDDAKVVGSLPADQVQKLIDAGKGTEVIKSAAKPDRAPVKMIGGKVKDKTSNSGVYAKDDQVFLHPDANSAKLSDADLAEVDRAVAAGAKFTVKDTDLNAGEKQLAAHLKKKGVVVEDLTPKKESKTKKLPAAKAEPVTKDDTQAVLDSHERSLSPDDRREFQDQRSKMSADEQAAYAQQVRDLDAAETKAAAADNKTSTVVQDKDRPARIAYPRDEVIVSSVSADAAIEELESDTRPGEIVRKVNKALVKERQKNPLIQWLTGVNQRRLEWAEADVNAAKNTFEKNAGFASGTQYDSLLERVKDIQSNSAALYRKLGTLSNAEFEALLERIDRNRKAFAEIRKKIRAMPVKETSGSVAKSELLPPVVARFASRVRQLLMGMYQSKGYQQTINELHDQISGIQRALAGMDQNGEMIIVPELRDAAFEQAYKRAEKFFGVSIDDTVIRDDTGRWMESGVDGVNPVNMDKRARMHAYLAQGNFELQQTQDKGLVDVAALFRRNISQSIIALTELNQKALSYGKNLDQIKEIYNAAQESLRVIQGLDIEEKRKGNKATEATDIAEAIEEAVMDAETARKAYANNLIAALKAGELNYNQAYQMAVQMLREGVVTQEDILDAYGANGLDRPVNVLSTISKLAVNTHLWTHLAMQKNRTIGRFEWLRSMDLALAADPSLLSRGVFTEGEIAAHKKWSQRRRSIDGRRNNFGKYGEFDKGGLFGQLIFNRFSLNQVTNQRLLNDQDRIELQAVSTDLRATWFEDVRYAAFYGYGKFRSVLLNPATSPLSQSEIDAYLKFEAQRTAAIEKGTEALIRSKYFEALKNLDGLARGGDVRNNELTSTPVNESELPSEVTVTNGSRSERVTASQTARQISAYEKFYIQMVNARIYELDQIMANAIEYHNAATANTPLGKGSAYVSPVAELRFGTPEYEAYQNQRYEIDEQHIAAEELNQDTINSLDAHRRMVAASARNRSARFSGEFDNGGFGMGVADAAERDLGSPATAAQQGIQSESSIDDQVNEELASLEDFDSYDDSFLDSYDKAEKDMFGTDGDAAMSAIAKSPHSPVLTVGFLQGFVQRIVSTWKGAPNVVVLDSIDQMPEPLRTQIREKLGAGYVGRGLYVNGTTYLFASGLNSEQEAEFVLFHESYGHYGMRSLLGDKLDSFLETAYRTNTKIRSMADQMMQERSMGRLEAVEEVLADMAGENKPLPIVKQWLGKVIAGLRNAGFNFVADWLASKTDAEVSLILNAARNEVLLGNQQSLESNLYELRLSTTERLPWEMFATKGGKTTAYARYNAGLDQWIAFVATGDDIRGGAGAYTKVTYNTLEEAYDALKFKGKVEKRQRSGLYEYNKKPERLVEIPQIKQSDSVFSLGSLLTKEGRAEWMRKLVTVMQNEYRPVFDVVDHLRQMGRVNENIDVKEALLLYERRTGNAVKFLRQKYVQPIMKLVADVKKQGGTEKDINDYLVARFADERNRAVANINDEMQDGGSGMTRETAEKVLADTATKPFYATLQEITRFTDQMGNEKVWYMFNHGMITQDARDKLLKYTKYVNLSGLVDDAGNIVDDPGAIAGGSKFNVKGGVKRAFGRGDGNVPQNVLARTIVAFEGEIIRSQKNLIAQRVLGLMEANYDPNFVVINKLPFVQKMNYDTGKVEMVPDENYIRRADVMVAKVRGIPVTMEFKDNRRGSFADSIHGLVAPKDPNAFMEVIGKFNQFIGQMLTTYNPAWAAVNFVRDSQTMFFNAAANGKLSSAQAAEMAKNLVPALRMAMFAISNGKRGNPPQEWINAYKEMTANGGLTSFVNREGLENQIQKIEDALSGKRSFDKTRSVLEWIENLSAPFEIAPRLAAYKVARDGGWSASQAAVLSGEITVNFNMRGSSKSMRQLYLFLNPAIQGTAIMYDLMKKNPKRFAALAGGMFAFGFATSLMGRAAGGQDDEGRDLIDKIPTFKRATSIVLWAGGPSIPIPYGWNAFFAAGTFSADMMLGKQTVGETSKRIFKTTLEAFSPMGTAGIDSKDWSTMLAKAIVPTAGLPLVEWIANENRFGSPIRKEQSPFESAKSPDSQMYFKSTSPISRFITETLNDMTTFGQAGNKFKSGLIDINPAGIDFAISAFLPGLVNEGYKAASLGTRAAIGETIKNTPLPLVDRFTAKIPESYDAGAFRRASEMIETAYKEFKNVPSARQQILGDFPQLAGAHAQVTSAVQQIRKLNSDNDKFQNNENISSDLKVQRANQTKERVEAVQRRVVKNLMDRSPKIYDAMQAND